MNGRTAVVWPLLFTWCMLMNLPDWSHFDLRDPGWIAVILAGAVALCGLVAGIYRVLRYIFKNTVYKYGNFTITFIDHLPISSLGSEPTEDPPNSIKVLPPGNHKLLFKIRAKFGFSVSGVNVRCLNLDGSNAPIQCVQIGDLQDPHYGLRRMDDGNGGIEAEYSQRRVLASGAGLYYEMQMIAKQQWKGILSYRANDETGFRSRGYTPIEICHGADAPRVRVSERIPASSNV